MPRPVKPNITRPVYTPFAPSEGRTAPSGRFGTSGLGILEGQALHLGAVAEDPTLPNDGTLRIWYREDAGITYANLNGTTYQIIPPTSGSGMLQHSNEWHTPDMALASELTTHIGAANPHSVYLLKTVVTTPGDILYAPSAGNIARLGIGANGQVLRAVSGSPSWQWEKGGCSFIIDGGGAVIATGLYGGFEVPYDCFVTGWVLLSTDGTSGAIVIDVWKTSYDSFPPTVANTIAGSEKPTILATNNKGRDLTLTTWTQLLLEGDILYFNVDSIASLKRVSISLRADKNRVS